jgi:SAM-dependent methyltransferase
MTNDILYISKKKSVSMGKQWFSEINIDHFWYKWRFDKFKVFLKASKIKLDSTTRILEVGMGTGILRSSIENHLSCSVDGADLDESVLSHSVFSKGKTYYYDINDRHFSLKGKYDLIILFDVLEHIEDENLFLNSIMFHLRRNGRLLINVPALINMYSRYDKAVGHFRRYNLHSLNKVLLINNFRVIEASYWGFFLLPLLYLRKFLENDNSSKDTIISKGFRPPNKIFSFTMKIISNIENLFLKKPFTGSSIMALYEVK